MPAKVQCPHCQSMCQVQDQNLGKNVFCGSCSKVFAAQVVETPSAPPNSGNAPATPTKGGLWSGVQSLYQKISKPISSAIHGKTASAAPETDLDPPPDPLDSDDDIGLELDEESLNAMKEKEEEEQRKSAPKLGEEPQGIHGRFRLDIGSASSPGRVRERNEDSHLVQQQTWMNLDDRHDMAMIVVADGMGGYGGGDRASHITIQQICTTMRPVWNAQFPNQNSANATATFKEQIDASIQRANTVVIQEGQKSAEVKGMGATVAVVLICDGQVEIGHVGDCRVYLYHAGELSQITKDQTLVGRMLELGQLTEAEAKDHPKGNEVTQAIGKSAQIQPQFYQQSLSHSDWLIVACDGLHAHVNSRMLAETLHAAPSSAAMVAHFLVDLANYHGGSDNCTVVALRCY